LALVVALLSVLTVVIPVMAKVFDDDRSRISLEPLRLRPSRLGDIDTFQIEAQVANVGKRAGVIRAVLIQFKKDVGCGANESVRSCGDTVLPVGSCELVYQLKGAPVETPTSRLVEPNQVEVAELHYLLNNGLKYDDVPSAWRKLYADVRNADGSKECLTVDVRSVMN
jgi:hypothetical protein